MKQTGAMLAAICDSLRGDDTANFDTLLRRAMQRVAEAAGLRYLAVALLDGSATKLEYAYEWSSDPREPAIESARRAVDARVKAATPRLMNLEAVEHEATLMVPFASRGGFAGILAVVPLRPRREWTDDEKHAFQLAAEMLAAKLAVRSADRELRAREKQLRLVLRATNDAVYEWAIGSNVVLWNDAVLELIGGSAETFDSSRDGWLARIVPEERESVLSGLRAAIENNSEAWSDEYRVMGNDGKQVWITDRASILRDSSGKAVKLIGAVMDVTGRRIAEEGRQAIQERYRRLVDQADDLIVTVGADCRITSLNPAFEVITGWRAEDWISRDPCDLLLPGYTTPELADALCGAAGGLSRCLSVVTSRGETVELDVKISPVVEDGRTAGASWIARDVTQRNRAGRERIALSKRVEMLLQSTYEGIVAVDQNGICYLVNGSACRMLGCNSEELIGKNFHDIVHPRHASEPLSHSKTLCPLGSLIELRIPAPLGDEELSRLDGTAMPVQFAGSLVDGESAGGAVVTFSDATERKVLQSELERAHRMASLGHVANTIAHEFNNVLMGIQPFVDLIGRRVTSDVVAEPLARIGQSIKRGKRISTEILRFSRPLQFMPKPVDVQTWLSGIADEARGVAGPSIAVELDLPDEPLFVRGDAELLHQAFVNIVSNALDAMPSGGTLRLAVRRCEPGDRFRVGELLAADRFIRFTISDDGCGMPEETLRHIFEPLFTTKKGQGTGLGLAVVHQIVTAHGGLVFADSTPDAGSTFSIFLSATDAPAAVDHPLSRPEVWLPDCRVLLVEDDDLVADGIRSMLETANVAVGVVSTGGAAVAAVEQFAPDVVVLDVGLPDLDGQEVFRRLRARWPRLPVIFSTGHAEAGSVADDRVRLLRKPYDTATLLRCIADFTSSEPESEAAP